MNTLIVSSFIYLTNYTDSFMPRCLISTFSDYETDDNLLLYIRLFFD
jgi:hypothetical protein